MKMNLAMILWKRDQITTKYDNLFMFIGDMNYDMIVQDKPTPLTNTWDIVDLHNIVESPTCVTKNAAPT